ncbi:ABC transporter ATP-binding protein, partial [Patescibacteria group bacterium]|nr:ABC transporter ATP-binding protein [Patescibacteria group bacterium]
VALLLSAYLNTKVIEDTKDIEADFRAYNRQYEEMIEKLSSFKAQGMDRKLLSQNEAQYQDIFRKDRKFWFWYIGRSQLRELIISVFVIIGAYIIGVYQIMTRPESLPLVIALFSWGGIQAASLRELARLERSLNKRLPSIVSFFEALELEPTREESGRRRFNKNEPFDISFENISHSYEDGKPALENINFTIKSGEKWAFVGESGSGKTTLVNLILGAMPPTKGSIYIIPHLTREKIDLWDVDLHWWRSEVLGYVPQDVVLKDGSLRENLLLAVPETQPEPTDAELMKVLERFNAVFRGHHDTSFLDIEVGRDGGIELSGGQRQRIGIARAVLKNASFLIFDEATSSLDARLTNSVTSAFKDALSPTTTSILIAHDLSTVAGGNPSKLINIGTDSNDLVCSHYMVLRPIEKSVINLSQVDYAGPWQGLVESEVMQELITESQRENLVDN